MRIDNIYENKRDKFEGDEHRFFIGGLWEEIGGLQFNFLLAQGLKPSHSLIDVGCGCLRGGMHFIKYLDPFKYFGTDINAKLIELGIKKELDEECREKINETSFAISDNFDFSFQNQIFDFGIAISLFTHLSEPKIIDCLQKLRPNFCGGSFFATFFINPYGNDVLSLNQKDGIVSHFNKDPFHYDLDCIQNMAEISDWKMNFIGEFNHPRNQKMVEFKS